MVTEGPYHIQKEGVGLVCLGLLFVLKFDMLGAGWMVGMFNIILCNKKSKKKEILLHTVEVSTTPQAIMKQIGGLFLSTCHGSRGGEGCL